MTRSLLESLESRRLLSAGDPDLALGPDGVRSLQGAYAPATVLKAVAVAGDKIVAAGSAGDLLDGVDRMIVARFDSVGNFDTTFGGGAGYIETSDALSAIGVAVQPDGRILALSGREVVRLRTDGSLDPTFGGGDGVAEVPGGTAYHFAMAPGGKIVVLTFQRDPSDEYPDPLYDPGLVRVARLTASGAIDHTFGGGDGIADFPTAVHTRAPGGVAVGADGRIVATAPAYYNQALVARWRADGSADSSFAGDGLVNIAIGYSDPEVDESWHKDLTYGVAVDAANRVVVVGGERHWNTVNPFRLNNDGSFDRFFTELRFSWASEVRREDQATVNIGPDGKMTVVGSITSYPEFGGRGAYLARYQVDGKLDVTFAGGVGYEAAEGGIGGFYADGRVVTIGVRNSDGSRPYDLIYFDRRETHPTLARYAYTGAPTPLPGVKLSAGGTLIYAGTQGPDEVSAIGFELADGRKIIRLRANGRTAAFPLSKVRRFYFDGRAGNDSLTIDAFNLPATLIGGNGNDSLEGGGGNQRLEGGAGDDGLYADAQIQSTYDSDNASGYYPEIGNDVLLGGDGNDFLGGGEGNDRLDGGRGADFLSGDDGYDTLDYGSRAAPVFVDVGDSRYEDIANDGEAGEHDVAGDDIEIVIGGRGNDVFRGSNADNVFYGNAGDDILDGRVGNDLLVGGLGRDSLFGGDGDDQLYGFELLTSADGGILDRLDGGLGFDKARKDDSDVFISIEKLV